MKAKIKDTGEVVDVHWEGDLDAWLGKLPSGRFREFKERELEFLETNNIDWEQRRYEIAKEVFASIYDIPQNKGLEKVAVRAADARISELKKGGDK